MSIGSIASSSRHPHASAAMSAPPSAESLAIQINPTISARVRQTLGVTDESPRIRLKGLEKTVRNLDGAGITNLLGALGVVSPTGLAEPRKLFARKPWNFTGGSLTDTHTAIKTAQKDGGRALKFGLMGAVVDLTAQYLKDSGVNVA